MTYIPINEVSKTPLRSLLSFPDSDREKAYARCCELQQLGVEALYLHGSSLANGQPVLGLGYCGLVLLGRWQGKLVAIKIRRSDSTQPDLSLEAEHQRFANRAGVGPLLHEATDSILVMEFLPGTPLGTWLVSSEPDQACEQVRQILGTLLDHAFALDQAGLDHGAVRCVAEHAIIGPESTTLIDFSHASRQRRAANVTTLIQGLFWGTRLAKDLACFLPLPNRDSLIPLLQQYKHQMTHANFKILLQSLPI